MTTQPPPPRIRVIDALFGRQIADRANRDRANLCGMYGLRDVTGDQAFPPDEVVVDPVADAVFFRGQRPLRASAGEVVENDLEGTIAFVRRGWESSPCWSLVLLDLCFYTGRVTEASHRSQPGMPEGRTGDDDPRHYFGLRILEQLHQEFPELPVVILSSKQRGEVSASFTAHGALGFIPRTDSTSPGKLRDYLWRHGLTADSSGKILGNSRPLLLALRAARRAGADRRNVLIRGERGAGKELLAAYINGSAIGKQGPGPLVTVDSGTLTPSLYASELFGHVKGAYTGADRERRGRIAQADGGDLFLDEIGNMPPDVQTGLLRVMESRVVVPLGAGAGRGVDVRFISATNEDIEFRAAAGGGFRADLLDRLREGGTIILPPLRDRPGDIPLLAAEFVRQAESANASVMGRIISPDAMEKLLAHDWPGNVRELRNCIFTAVNDHPDVEYLVPGHLLFPTEAAPVPLKTVTPRQGHALTAPPPEVPGLEDICRLLGAARVEPAETAGWAGRWPLLQREFSGLALRLLRAALFSTRRVSIQHPDGEVKIHPAIKLLTGDPSITATQAADLVKRLFSGVPESMREEILSDPVLKIAHDTALRLRPRISNRKGKTP